MLSTQRFVIAALIMLALLAAASYGVGLWSLQYEGEVTPAPSGPASETVT